MCRFAPVAMTLLLMLGASTASFAHTVLDHTEPGVGETVATAPRELRLWFTQKLEQAFSTIKVTDGSGQRVDTGKVQVDGNEMSIPLRTLGPGTYRVKWHVLSTDTHTTDGNFTFIVGK